MRISRRWIRQYAHSLDELAASSQDKLVKAIERLNPASVNFQKDLQTVFQAICWTSAQQAASMAATFCDGIEVMQTGTATGAVAEAAFSEKGTAIAASAILKDGLTDRSMSLLKDRISWEIKHSAGECVKHNAWSQSVRTVKAGKATAKSRRQVRYARVPQGSEAYPEGCPFCQMLASRGFVYMDADKAGADFDEHYHPGCQCMVVPSYEENATIEGYDPDAYYDSWIDSAVDTASSRAEANGTTTESEVRKYFDDLAVAAGAAKERTKIREAEKRALSLA